MTSPEQMDGKRWSVPRVAKNIACRIKTARQQGYRQAIEDAAALCETGRFIPIERPAKEKLAWSCALTEAAKLIRSLKPTDKEKG